ncbi:MAG: tripartite tricarboxylate transporter substrate binding protein, partial [Gammaproteobacteria bacterium]|nr:tripartite tricarboxylate transporter substrate binding protein [Gammaproteobacteria bacterium]
MKKTGNTVRKQFGLAAAAISLALFGSAAVAEFPDKPIQFIIPFGAGGSADIEGRLLADEMGKVLGVTVV